MKNLNISVKLTLLACALFSQVIKASGSYSADMYQLVYNTTDKPIIFDLIATFKGSDYTTIKKTTTIPPKSFVAVPVKYSSAPSGAHGWLQFEELEGLVWSSSRGTESKGNYYTGPRFANSTIYPNIINVDSIGRRVGIFANDATKYSPIRPLVEGGVGALTRLLKMGLKDVSNISADPVIKKALADKK